jgi:hypothetical protein
MVTAILQTSRRRTERGEGEERDVGLGLQVPFCQHSRPVVSIYLELKPWVFYTVLYYCCVSLDSQ